MYCTKLMEDGKWWVGWRYSTDGHFDPIAVHKSMDDALRAAFRMEWNQGPRLDAPKRERI